MKEYCPFVSRLLCARKCYSHVMPALHSLSAAHLQKLAEIQIAEGLHELQPYLKVFCCDAKRCEDVHLFVELWAAGIKLKKYGIYHAA